MTESAPPPARSDWLRKAVPLSLLLSVCLNIGLASFIAMRVWSAEPTPVIVQTPQQLFGMLAARLPADDSAVFKKIVQGKEAELQAARTEQQRARMRIIRVLAQHDLDQAAFQAALKDLRNIRGRATEITFDIIEQTMKEISPQTRRNLLAQFRLH